MAELGAMNQQQPRKRPEQQIYRPGAFRGGRNGKDEQEEPAAEGTSSWPDGGSGKHSGKSRRGRGGNVGGIELLANQPSVASERDPPSVKPSAPNKQRPAKQTFEQRDYGLSYQGQTSSRPKDQKETSDQRGADVHGSRKNISANYPPVERHFSRRQSEDRQSLYDGDDRSRCGTPDTIAGDRPNGRRGGRRMGMKRNSVNDINFSPRRGGGRDGGQRRRSDQYSSQNFRPPTSANWDNRSGKMNTWTAPPKFAPVGGYQEFRANNRAHERAPHQPPSERNVVHQHQRNDREFGRLRGQSNDVRYQGVRAPPPQQTHEPQSSGENWRQYVNRVEAPVSRPSNPNPNPPLPVPSLLDRAKLDEIGSSFESLLKEPVGHLDWSSEVEHELERRAEEEKRQRAQASSAGQRGGLIVVSREALFPRPPRGFTPPKPMNQSRGGRGGHTARNDQDDQSPSASSSTTYPNRGFMASSSRAGGSGRGGGGRRGFSSSSSSNSNLPPRFQRQNSQQRVEQQSNRPQQSPRQQKQEEKMFEEQRGTSAAAAASAGIQSEISANQGPQIELLNDRMTQLLQSMHRGVDALSEIIVTSAETADLYRQIIPLDIDYSFQTNLEQHLWKQSFYKPIEELRHFLHPEAINDPVANALLTLIGRAREFYASLIAEYEQRWKFKLDDFVYWPSGLPIDDFEAALMCPAKEATDRTVKVALLSAQRLIVSLGDLLRYETQIKKQRDFSLARSYYLKAVQLSPTNGRSHNQLGLLAVYAKKLDMMYHYVRAIAARHAFDTARQSLLSGFDEMRKRVDVYEKELREQLNVLRSSESKTADSLRDRPREIWIGLDGKESKGEAEELSAKMGDLEMRMLCNETAATLYKRAVYYTLHVAGMLVMKIGMEQYDQLAEKAVMQLRALLAKEESPLTAQQLIQLTTICLYCVHSSSIKDMEPGTCPLQQQQAVQLVLSIWGVLLEQLNAHLTSLASFLRGEMQPPPQLRRVLPAVQLMCEWASTPLVNEIYRAMPSLDGIDSERMRVDIWAQLAILCNQLVAVDEQGLVSKPLKAGAKGSVEMVLPESVYSTSFCNVFSGQPKTLSFTKLPFECPIVDWPMQSVYALHARLRSVLSAAEYLDGSELRCFQFENGRFVSTETGSCSSPVPPTGRRAFASDDEGETAEQQSEEDEEGVSDEQRQFRLQRKQQRLKQTMHKQEADLRGLVIEVRPSYVIPDTNTFIDHMTTLATIIESSKYNVLVPTVVLSELRGLSAAADDEWVRDKAHQAVDYLNKAEGLKLGLKAITSMGSQINSLQFAHEDCGTAVKSAINDDKILMCCMSLCSDPALRSDIQDLKTQGLRLKRNFVLLTEDRALNIKAVAKNIPVRTVPSFARWAHLI